MDRWFNFTCDTILPYRDILWVWECVTFFWKFVCLTNILFSTRWSWRTEKMSFQKKMVTKKCPFEQKMLTGNCPSNWFFSRVSINFDQRKAVNKIFFWTKSFSYRNFCFEENLFLREFLKLHIFLPNKIIGGICLGQFCLENIYMFDTKNTLQINNAQFWPLSEFSVCFLAWVRENFLYIHFWLYCIYTGQVQFDNTLTFKSLMH